LARVARERSRTGIYHIMLRGINRQTIFEDNQDRVRFLDTLEEYKDICEFVFYGYCLMDNHVHLLIKETKESVSDIIKRICSSYVYWYNAKYKRCGHLFQERFKSEIVETDSYFLTVLRYIHQNPLKAKTAESVAGRENTRGRCFENTRGRCFCVVCFITQCYSMIQGCKNGKASKKEKPYWYLSCYFEGH